jgi:hypothetical protein
MQRVFAVRIGDKYGPHYEDYINSKIPNVTWIREESIGKLQWNKLIPMSLDIDEPVVVIDIDMLFIHDYMDVINYPIQPGEFVSMPAWWSDAEGYTLQGGFQKYYPKDCKYIYDEFVSKPDYWMEYYIKNGTTIGPVNGEQYFIEDQIRDKLKLKLIPETWVTRWEHQMTDRLYKSLNLYYQADWLRLGGEFYSDLRLVHFLDQGSLREDELKALVQSLTSED